MRISVIHILIFTLCLSWGVSAHAQEVVTLTNGEWPPLFSEEFKYGGIGSKICEEAFNAAGISVKYVYMPWKRGFEEARAGQWDGTVGWRKTPEREKDFLFSDPILDVDTVFFHRKGRDFSWESLDDIGSMTIGVTLGYGYIDMLEKAAERNGGRVEVAPTDELNLQKLVAGRIDIFPCAEFVGYYILRAKMMAGSADLVHHAEKPLWDNPLHLLISKDHTNGAQLIERFNQGLKIVRESGKYEQYEFESLRGDYLPDTY
ncbi:MAG: transporter substrate-binding domain-containing protein [Pseudodesulfovibrio sp.]